MITGQTGGTACEPANLHQQGDEDAKENLTIGD